MFEMKVQTKYYQLLKRGIKTIELRLFDEKRQQIKVGDEIQFSDLSNSNDTFKAVVLQLHHANSFGELCQIIPLYKTGFSKTDELLTCLQEFYPPEKQQKYGVLGIEVKKI